MPRPLRGLIGLTGNIATGKSTVRAYLAALGFAVIDADQVARDIMVPGQPALARIYETFGANYALPDGGLDRRKLGNLVFNDPAALKKLEAITHPAARAELWRRVAHAYAEIRPIQPEGRSSPALVSGDDLLSSTRFVETQLVVIEVIRLFEGGYAADCQEVWVTTCPPDIQIARLIHGRGLSETEARARVAAQPPQAEKLAKANRIFHTDRPLAQTQAEVLAAVHAMRG